MIEDVISQDQLIEMQENDPDLAIIRNQVVSKAEASKNQVSYYRNYGVLMRRWRPPDAACDEDWRVVHQVVVPKQLRRKVFWLAHEGPLAGHLGITKTRQKVLKHFYWPGIGSDVANLCRSCHICQVTGKPNQDPQVAPLVPIPTMDEPFNRVIIDCVGPLPKTKSGNQYLLTIMCTSTRFPEAIPLKNIRAPNIIKRLIKFFTLVGLPKAIQSDQGTNFMAGVFQQVMYELGIKQYTSSAYHPQSQGALERFHQTLKSMLRAYCYEQDKDWDEGVHLLLFAAREAVQESLGFSPFELLFGREVRGPLKLLKESWLDNEDQVGLLDQVTKLRQRMRGAGEIARENLKAAQTKMKTWYDRKARKRSFEVGDEVLILLPLPGHPLQARYSGPYTIEKKLNEVDYVVKTPGRRKEKRLCHINMLKLYQAREHDKVETLDRAVCIVTTGANEETIETGPKLVNSQILQNLKSKLVHLTPDKQADIKRLLLEFQHLFPDVPSCTTCIYHDVEVGTAAPCKQHPYRVNPIKLQYLKKEIEYMLKNKIIEPSNSDWSSPCILVPKPDGTYRFCTDFRKLNAVTKADSFPLPRIEDCIDKLGTAKYVTTLDLLKGYWQVPLTDRAKELSAFVTPEGLYQYRVMPFGMKNAPATFQRMVNKLVDGLYGCEAYIDDVIIYGNSWEEHYRRLQAVFKRFSEANLTVNLSKSEFGHAEVIFLGHVVGSGQVKPVTVKIQALINYPVPTNKQQVMRFLGMAGYYRRFCRNFSVVTAPLTNLLKKCQEYQWTPDCQAAFQKVKMMLSSKPILRAPDFQKQFYLMVDASDTGAGAVLMQCDDLGIEHPVCYFSRKFDQHQKNYSTIEKEALALLLALQHFDVYLNTTVFPIVVYTDHNPLVFVNKMKNNNQRLLRWSLLYQEFNIEIHHVRGKDNVIADALSRI